MRLEAAFGAGCRLNSSGGTVASSVAKLLRALVQYNGAYTWGRLPVVSTGLMYRCARLQAVSMGLKAMSGLVLLWHCLLLSSMPMAGVRVTDEAMAAVRAASVGAGGVVLGDQEDVRPAGSGGSVEK